MEDPETLSHVTRLLELFPEVRVTGVQDAPSMTRIFLSVGSDESLARLAPITFAANVSLNVHLEHWVNPPPKSPRPDLLRYQVRVPRDADWGLRFLGAELARNLKAIGWLAAEEADALLRQLNAADYRQPPTPS